MRKNSSARLDVRLAPPVKDLIDHAANLLGQTVSAFAVSTLAREAERVNERFGHLVLDDRDRDAFIAALDDAEAEPSPRLRKAVKEFAEKVAR